MPVMESSLPNIPAAVPFDPYEAKQEEEAAKVNKEINSKYMANMILPEIVQSSRKFPLGPQCIITYSDVPDQALLIDVDLYWYISLEKGCVECKVNVFNTGILRKATTSDPRVIITRKPRRFEAYCCSICRSNFVTVVQALLHMKAYHRQDKKILIQDRDVFHDIDKAMEVPPVPLPWYVARKTLSDQIAMIKSSISEQGTIPSIQFTPSSTGGESDSTSAFSSAISSLHASDKGEITGEVNPVTSLLQAIVKEYGKQVQTVLFGKDFSEVKVHFEDKTSVLAHLPDLVNQEEHDMKDEIDPDEKLDFQVFRMTADGDDEESCVVRVNNPALAQREIISALKQGVSQSTDKIPEKNDAKSEEQNASHTDNASSENEMAKTDGHLQVPKDLEPSDTPPIHSPKKFDSRGRPSKTVRFMVGCPDSDEDGNSSASERADRDDHNKSAKVDVTDDKKTKEDEGLKGVVSKLISTASKGRIPLDPTSPVTTVAPSPAMGVREEILATAAIHVQNLPKNLSVPNLSSMPGVSMTNTTTPVITPISSNIPTTSGMVRVQSWGGSAGPLNKFTLSAYPPSLQKLENMSTSELRQSFLTAGRAFTYAEKIKLMKKLNDEDSMFTQAHVRSSVAGKIDTDNPQPAAQSAMKQQRVKIRKTSSSGALEMESTEAISSPVIKMTPGASIAEEDSAATLAAKRKSMGGWPTDGRKKRRSKYDVHHLMTPDMQPPIIEEPKKRRPPSSSEGSVSDHEERESQRDPTEEREPNPASLLEVMRATYPAYLTQKAVPFHGQPSQDTPVSYPSMLSSEYYGSGEWANTAMQTLRSLQSSLEAVSSTNLIPQKWEEKVKKEPADNDDSDSNSRTSSPFDTAAVTKTEDSVFNKLKAEPSAHSANIPGINTSSASRTTEADDAVLRLAKQIIDEKSKAESGQETRSLSPLLTEEEKEMIRSRGAVPSVEQTVRKIKNTTETEKQARFGSKFPSDPNLKRRSRKSDQNPKVEYTVAKKGDGLEFLTDVTYSSLKKNERISMKYHESEPDSGTSSSNNQSTSSMDMPQIFQNSIDTFIKVQYIEKFSVCRVCGYTLVVDDNNESSMNSHVMEHSLKELLQTRYNGKQM